MQKAVPVTFTELLYSVVIGTAITRIESLDINQPNVLLFIALIIVFDDYFLYHQEVEEVEYSGRSAIGIFWLDMLVLIVWYALSISTKYSVTIFFFWVAIFFVSTSIWELVFSDEPFLQRVIWASDLVVTFTAISLALLSNFLKVPYWIYVIIFLLCFAIWRLWSYREIWRIR